MMKQILRLFQVQLLQSYGLNEAFHSRDAGKRGRAWLMGGCYLLLGILLAGYSSIQAMGLILIGAGELVPAYTLTTASLLILLFTMMKAGNILYDGSFEILFSLPVSNRVIVTSRALTMYAGNLLIGGLLIVPGSVLYGILLGRGPGYYMIALLGFLSAPLLPMSVASAVGALIVAIGSRVKHKNLAISLLSILAVLGLTGAIIVLSFRAGGANAGSVSIEDVGVFTRTISELLFRVYLPARLYTRAFVQESVPMLILFVVISAAVCLLLITVVSWKYTRVLAALRSRETRGGYELTALKQKPVLRTLYEKELRRYFASRIYATNSMVGLALMFIMTAALLFIGRGNPEKFFATARLSELEQSLMVMGQASGKPITANGLTGVLTAFLPYVLAMLSGITYPAIVSISMEGRQWWIAQSLPVSARKLFNAKALADLTITLPFTLASGVLAALALSCGPEDFLWMLLLPTMYNLFFAEAGITINARMPMLNWEKEIIVVKQSSSVVMGMLFSFVVVAIPVGLLFAAGLNPALIHASAVGILAAATAGMYAVNSRLSLNKIQ